MTFEEIEAMINSVGLPVAYYSFPEKEAPVLPYIVYYYPSTNNFAADDSVYGRINALNIELYTKDKDFELEETVEAVLDGHQMVWNKNESYLDSEHMYEVLYEMEINING